MEFVGVFLKSAAPEPCFSVGIGSPVRSSRQTLRTGANRKRDHGVFEALQSAEAGVHPAALRGSHSIILRNPVACAPWNRRPGRRRFPGRRALARGRLDFSSTVGVREPAFSKDLQRLSQARRPALPESQGRQPAKRGRPNGNSGAELRLPGRVFETCGNDVDRETAPGGRGRLGVKGGVDVGADDGSRRTRAPLSDKPRGAANENWMFREE